MPEPLQSFHDVFSQVFTMIHFSFKLNVLIYRLSVTLILAVRLGSLIFLQIENCSLPITNVFVFDIFTFKLNFHWLYEQ